MRWVPIASWLFTLISFILSLVILFAGSVGENPNAAAIATSPPGKINPSSITKWLGLKDWYSIHYLSICSGFYEPSSTDPEQLSSTKVNITCSRQPSGYTFSLSDILREELEPGVKELADQVPYKNYDIKPWIALWYIGIVTAFLELVALPFTFAGTWRINLYTSILAGILFITLDISAGLATGHALGVPRSGEGPYPEAFLGLIWSATVCLALAFIAEQLEWKYQIWTPVGQRITIYRKPRDASWWAMRPQGTVKLRRGWDARRGI